MYSSEVTILKVEPGGYTPWEALFSRLEFSVSAVTSSQIPAISLGLKSGLETMASIFPVSGSMTTIAPSYMPIAL